MHRLARGSFLNAILSESKFKHGEKSAWQSGALFVYGLMHFCFWSNAEHAESFRILERKCSAKMAAQSTIAPVKQAPKQHPASNIFRANRSSVVIFFLLLVCLSLFLGVLGAQEAKPAGKTYFVKLVCESADKIVTVRFAFCRAISAARTELFFPQTRKLILYPSATDDRSVLQ